MLRKYISLVLEAQRGIMYPPDRINAATQSQISQEQTNDKTNLSPEEVAHEISSLWGDNTFISFARGYKDHPIPSVDINSYARYATPHGIYTYLFNKKNMTDLFLNQRIGRVSDFMDRPYFHIISLKSTHNAEINRDKTSNYYGLKSLPEDIISSPYADHLSSEILKKDYDLRVFPKYKNDIKEMLRTSLLSQPVSRSRQPIKRGITSKNYLSELYRTGFSFKNGSIGRAIFYAYDSLCRTTDSIPFDDFIENVTNFLIQHSENIFSSNRSKYYKSDFIKKDINNSKYFLYNIYNIADILSYITPNPKQGSGRSNDSSRMSIILHSIGIDAIIDKGSKTLHSKQPEQAALIGWGPHVPYENLGTYSNIFLNCSAEELENLYNMYIA